MLDVVVAELGRIGRSFAGLGTTSADRAQLRRIPLASTSKPFGFSTPCFRRAAIYVATPRAHDVHFSPANVRYVPRVPRFFFF